MNETHLQALLPVRVHVEPHFLLDEDFELSFELLALLELLALSLESLVLGFQLGQPFSDGLLVEFRGRALLRGGRVCWLGVWVWVEVKGGSGRCSGSPSAWL